MLPITNTHELDEYLKNNISEINKKRVMFTTIHKLSMDSLMAVKNILVKHKIYKYGKAMIE
jgi:type I site-specific restriction-modification system R (restriction) subunit